MIDDVPTHAETATDATSASALEADATPSGRLEPVPGEWRRLAPAYLWVDLIGNLVTGALMIGASTVPLWVLEWSPWWWLVVAAVSVISIVLIALTPRRVRAIGYQLREDDLLFRKGLMFQRFVAVPYGRMQLVDVNRGPLARALGLAELKLVTAAAASGVTIPGLLFEDAEQLRDHLVEVAETRRAGL